MRKKRIISLLPNATEIVCALGAGDQLIGRSHECDYPSSVLSLPICTAPKLNTQASSSEIDRQVKNLLQEAVSIYQIDKEKLKQLQPDIILTQAQCEVCAVSLPEVEQIVSAWTGNKPQIISLSPNRLADIWEDIRRIIEVLDLGEKGRDILRALKNRVVAIIEKTCVMKVPPSVVCIEWIEPLMAAGNWMPELVELAGGRNLIGEAGKHSPWMEWPALLEADPEVIVVIPCGFDIKRTRTEMTALIQKTEWSQLQAVKKKRVFLADGNQYFNRPGPRIVESLEILTEILHPDRFNFGRKGKAWEKL
ncbi:MAG: periplasmic binding protein [Pedosphaera sp.]|nr:periplasmic binding protein [Pedosphaera sp.]